MKSKKENSLLPIAVGLFMVLSYVIMKLVCRDQYDFIHIISDKIAFPPMWIFNFLYMITLFLFGVGAGFIFDHVFRRGRSSIIENYFLKGAVFSVAVYFLSLLWCPALFSLRMTILSLIISSLTTVCVVVTIIFWFRACSVYAGLVIPYAAWTVYLNVMNLIIIFTM